MNTQQWENQKRLYQPRKASTSRRAPTDTWNLWHWDIDDLFDRIIENMIVREDVDPNKVYVMGYSRRMGCTRSVLACGSLGGCSQMAGHPNDAAPDSLQNTTFTPHGRERHTAATRWPRPGRSDSRI